MDANAVGGIIFIAAIIALIVFLKRMKKRKRSGKPRVIWRKKYKNSDSFRGYKRIPLATYKEYGCEEGLANITPDSSGEVGRAKITLEYIIGDGWKAINVYIDGNKAGAFYDNGTNELFNIITSGRFDSVHVKIGEGNTVYGTDESGNLVAEQRPRPYLFIRVK